MYTVKTTIQGVAPLLFNKPDDERVVTGTITEETRKAAASKNKVHRNGHGVFIPAWNIKQTLIKGCQNTLKGKNSITNYVKAACFPKDALLGCTDVDFLHECWGRVPPRTGALVKIWRPAMKEGWELPVEFIVTDDRLGADALRLGWEHSGLMIGLGSWRPEYGRFIVLNWKVAKAKSA